MGGGRQEFLPTTVQDVEGNPGKRTDGVNLIKEWQHKHRKHNAQYIQSKAELLNVSSICEWRFLNFVCHPRQKFP